MFCLVCGFVCIFSLRAPNLTFSLYHLHINKKIISLRQTHGVESFSQRI